MYSKKETHNKEKKTNALIHNIYTILPCIIPWYYFCFRTIYSNGILPFEVQRILNSMAVFTTEELYCPQTIP